MIGNFDIVVVRCGISDTAVGTIIYSSIERFHLRRHLEIEHAINAVIRTISWAEFVGEEYE